MSERKQLARGYREAEEALGVALDELLLVGSASACALIELERQRDDARERLMAHLFDASVDAHGLKHAGFLRFIGYGRYNSQIAYFADDSDTYRVTFTPALTGIKEVGLMLQPIGDHDVFRCVWAKEVQR